MIASLRFIYPPEVVSKPQIRFKGKASGGLKPLLEPISKMWIRIHGKARFGKKAEPTR
jgi:hypothetical protein